MIKYELHLCQSPACKEEALSFLNSLSLSAGGCAGAGTGASIPAAWIGGSEATRRTALCSPLPMDTNTRNGSGLGAFEGKKILKEGWRRRRMGWGGRWGTPVERMEVNGVDQDAKRAERRRCSQ